jgi:hypothetical protein
MNENTKQSMNKLEKYFREVSIVIIGVAVTLAVGYWLTLKNEKRDITLYLNTMKMELEANISELDSAANYYRLSVEYTNYLHTHAKDSLELDSIMHYLFHSYGSRGFIFKTNAFEMFKNSGTMRLMNNKALLSSIWDIYTDFTQLKEGLDIIDKIKTEHILKDWTKVDDVRKLKIEQFKTNPPMYHYYAMGIPIGGLSGCEEVLEKSKEVIIMLEKELNP